MTITVILYAYFKKIELKRPSIWFSESDSFGSQQQRLITHQERILGTLGFWKNKAALHNRINMSKTYWSLISSIVIPVLLQFYDNKDVWANVFMTVITTWSAILVGLDYTLKSEQKYRGFRQCESDYYDLARRLLDHPKENEEELKEQVDEFLEAVEQIRKIGRAVETDSTISIIVHR